MGRFSCTKRLPVEQCKNARRCAGSICVPFLVESSEVRRQYSYYPISHEELAQGYTGLAVGFAVNAVLSLFGKGEPTLRVDELCAHSRCSCKERKGIFVPALVHTAEIFVFILVISGIVELVLHFVGEDGLRHLILNSPWCQ